jgi:peptidoglycan/LPS O-acetylase OafA/YrhL
MSSPIFALGPILVALGTMRLLRRRGHAPTSLHAEPHRWQSLDGLRGLLAICVFVHHASVWYYFLKDGVWNVPPSNLYVHLGESSVVLFFLLTAFLFVSKLTDSRARSLDWGHLYAGRLRRIVPLYLCLLVAVLVLVGIRSGFRLQQEPRYLAEQLERWFFFSNIGPGGINGVDEAPRMVAWATWTLSYEWLFYGLLPVVALSLRIVVPFRYLLLSGLFLMATWRWQPDWTLMEPFLGGLAAVAVVRVPVFRRLAGSPFGSVLIVGALWFVTDRYSTAYQPAPIAVLTLVFALIAGGNTLFGLLTVTATKDLGALTYSVYLLHGLVLYLWFTHIGRSLNGALASPHLYWLGVTLLTPVLIGLATVTYRWVELPAMRRRSSPFRSLALRLPLHDGADSHQDQGHQEDILPAEGAGERDTDQRGQDASDPQQQGVQGLVLGGAPRLGVGEDARHVRKLDPREAETRQARP